MKREIKFRARVKWSGNYYHSGDWVCGFLLQKEDGKYYILDTEEETLSSNGEVFGFVSPRYEEIEVDEKTIGQYTGLKDKNGKEIYEGDILKRKRWNGKYEVVEWGQRHGNHAIDWAVGFSIPFQNSDDCEIIGNKWENPELLK